MPIHRVGEIEKLEIDLKRKSLCRESMPVGAIVFPFYRHHSPARIESYSPAATALELLGSCLNYENHREEAVNHLCGPEKQLSTFLLYFSSSKNATEMIKQANKDWYSI